MKQLEQILKGLCNIEITCKFDDERNFIIVRGQARENYKKIFRIISDYEFYNFEKHGHPFLILLERS